MAPTSSPCRATFDHYDLVIGLYKGQRVPLKGGDSSDDRVTIARLKLQRTGGQITAITAEQPAGKRKPKSDDQADFAAHLNRPGTWIDFGPVATDGAVKINRGERPPGILSLSARQAVPREPRPQDACPGRRSRAGESPGLGGRRRPRSRAGGVPLGEGPAGFVRGACGRRPVLDTVVTHLECGDLSPLWFCRVAAFFFVPTLPGHESVLITLRVIWAYRSVAWCLPTKAARPRSEPCQHPV